MSRVIHHSNLYRLFLLSLILNTKRKWNHINAMNIDTVTLSQLPRILQNAPFIPRWQNLIHHQQHYHDSSKRSLRKRKRRPANNYNNNIVSQHAFQNKVIQDLHGRYMLEEKEISENLEKEITLRDYEVKLASLDVGISQNELIKFNEKLEKVISNDIILAINSDSLGPNGIKNQFQNIEVIIMISNECNQRRLGSQVGMQEGLTLNYTNNLSWHPETQETLEIVCLQIKGKISFDFVSKISAQRKKELIESLQKIVYEKYNDIVSELDAIKYPGMENKFALISLKKTSLLYNNELGSEMKESPNETKPKEKPSLFKIILGFLVVAIGAFGILSWIIIFYVRHKNLKLRREVENKRSMNIAPIIIPDDQRQQDSNKWKKVLQIDCNCCNTRAKREGYDQALSSKGDEDSFFQKLQDAANSPNNADDNSSSHALLSNHSGNRVHNDFMKEENKSFEKDDFFITSIEPSTGKSSFDNISTDFVKSWEKEPSSSSQNKSSQIRPTSTHEQTVMKDRVTWKNSQVIATSAQSNVETMLLSGSSFDDDYELEEDNTSIEVSISERNYPDFHYSETDTNPNNPVEHEREPQNGFLIYESEKSEKENYISKDEYDAAVSAAEEVLRKTDFFTQRLSPLKQDYGASDLSMNDESTNSANDEYSRRGELSLLEAFNELRDVSRFVKKYEQMKKNETKGDINTVDIKKGRNKIGTKKTSAKKESNFDNGSNVINQKQNDEMLSKSEISEDDHSIALERALNAIQTHKILKRKHLNQHTTTNQSKTNNGQIRSIAPKVTQDRSLPKSSSENKKILTENDEQQSDTTDVEIVSFPSIFAKRLGIKPYVPKPGSRMNQHKENKSNSKAFMTKQENKLKTDYPEAKKNVNMMNKSADSSVSYVEYNSNLNDSTDRSSVSEKLVAPSSIQIHAKLRRSKATKFAGKETKKIIENLPNSVETSDQMKSTPRLTSASLASLNLAQNENEFKQTQNPSDCGSSTGTKSLISMFESQRSPTSKALYPQNIHWQYGAGQISKAKKSFVSAQTKSTR